MPEVIFLCGVPGAGKTTYAKKHYPNHALISTDTYTQAIAERKGITYAEAFRLHINESVMDMVEEIARRTSRGENVIIDQTNLSIENRRKKFHLIDPRNKHNYTWVAINFPIGAYEQKARLAKRPGKVIPEDVLVNYRKQWKPATVHEGFHKIINVKAE